MEKAHTATGAHTTHPQHSSAHHCSTGCSSAGTQQALDGGGKGTINMDVESVISGGTMFCTFTTQEPLGNTCSATGFPLALNTDHLLHHRKQSGIP